ncbi:MAG: antioxidant AhpC [Bacteroidetes bacterium HGW-Bacteroidetes-12]|nr:MAG: antioxidant AhpC [Bacteroidetes bacterium HGW-Bacteroidetes-12]
MKKTILLTLIATAISLSFKAQVAENATDISPLLIGENAPDVEVKDINGKATSLKAILTEKPTIIMFYRGGWCPFCNAHLAELQEAEKEINALGFQMVAISPDSPEKLKESLGKHKLTYKLYSDADLKVAQAFGIAFKAPDQYKPMLLEASGNANEGILPVPSVFVFNTTGVIDFEYINPNVKARLSAAMLLAVLKTLK